MNSLNLIPIFLIGLLGSVHCIGMCGGIVGALSMAPVTLKSIPIAVKGEAVGSIVWCTLFYNVGRIASYTCAGALVGGLANGAQVLTGLSQWQSVAYILTNLMLLALGLYLMNVWRGLAQLETMGYQLWRYVQPLGRCLFPLNNPMKLFLAGTLWGWLPCAMVYSVLLTAMLSGTAYSGAVVMFAFGLGTLPMMLAAGLFGAQLRSFLQRRVVRLMCGMSVFVFGVLGLLRSGQGVAWLDLFCMGSV